MPDSPNFYFDTYALIERLQASDAYVPYADEPIFTHQMNAYELVGRLLRDFPESRARQALTLLAPNFLDAETDDLFASARFRNENLSKRMSHVDALGYVLARKNGLKFLTGDKAFKDVVGVEFVP